MTKREFKLGDKVRVTVSPVANEHHQFNKGEIVTVTKEAGRNGHFTCVGLKDWYYMESHQIEHVEEFVNGQEVEVRDRYDAKWEPAKFLCMTSKGYPVVEFENGVSINYKHCRSIDETPEYTMEQAIEKMGHDFKIKK